MTPSSSWLPRAWALGLGQCAQAAPSCEGRAARDIRLRPGCSGQGRLHPRLLADRGKGKGAIDLFTSDDGGGEAGGLELEEVDADENYLSLFWHLVAQPHAPQSQGNCTTRESERSARIRGALQMGLRPGIRPF